jgi:hypothetical protein
MESNNKMSGADILFLLEKAEIQIEGLVPWGSNYTFLVKLCHESVEAQGIYKPKRGERPLWDFPSGSLCLRERAAFLISEVIGWNIVPPTVLRQGPQGQGSLQYFIDHDPNQHYFTLKGQFDDQIQKIVLFDIFTNNADRKGGHVIVDQEDHVWAIDHGICFHVDYKLRTVIWDFAGLPIPATLLANMQGIYEALAQKETPLSVALQQLLHKGEIKALQARIKDLLTMAHFPEPGPGRHYPWPLV